MLALYSDGGLIGKNPSHIGGTFAWCLVKNDKEIILDQSGIILPSVVGLKTVTNNISELIAALKALESLNYQSKKEIITLYTDSGVTQSRLTGNPQFRGVPFWIREWVSTIKKLKNWNVKLLGGHPNKKELVDGKRKDGKPVSKWNVLCDKQCTNEAKKHLEKLSLGSILRGSKPGKERNPT